MTNLFTNLSNWKVKYTCALLMFVCFGVGTAWGAQPINSQAPANGKSFIIALYYNGKYHALPANLTNTGVTPAGLECTLDANNKVSAISTCDTPDECLWYFETATGGYNISYVDAEDTKRYLYKNGTTGNNYNISANANYKSQSVWAFTSGTLPNFSVTAYSMKTTKTADSGTMKHTVMKAKNNTSFQVNGTTNTYVITLLKPAPRINCATSSLTGFTYAAGNGPSDAQSFSVSGSHLTADITVSAPSNFEVSTSSGSGYSSSVTLTQSSGSVGATTVYIRLKSGLSTGSYTGTSITMTSTGAANKTISLSGSVTAACSADPSVGSVSLNGSFFGNTCFMPLRPDKCDSNSP